MNENVKGENTQVDFVPIFVVDHHVNCLEKHTFL